jgi:hypothetical protein
MTVPKSISANQTFQIPPSSEKTSQAQPSDPQPLWTMSARGMTKLGSGNCQPPVSSELFSTQYTLHFLRLKKLVDSKLLAGSTPTMLTPVEVVPESTLRKIEAVDRSVEVFLKIGDLFDSITSSCECDDLCQERSRDTLFLTQLLGTWVVLNIPKYVL